MSGRTSDSSSRSSFSRSSLPRKSSYSYSSPKSPVTTFSPPVTSPYAPPTMTHNIQLEKPGFFSNIWQGFGLGAGLAIAHNIFRSDPKVVHVRETPHSSGSSSPSKLEDSLPKEFVQCMKDNNNDKDLCKQFLE